AQRPTVPAAPAGRRRAPWVVAAVVAGVVVVAGLAWPEPNATAGEDSAAQSGEVVPTGASSGASTGASSATATAATPVATADAEDPTVTAERLIAALAACAGSGSGSGSSVCPEVMEDPSAAVPAGVVSAGDPETSVMLLDEYGGVAVFRVEAPGVVSQVLVLVSADGQWLVRDVYDIADQP
ncbi:MAG: hypothetical protein QM677_10800, partial [Microbacterium sp.]